MLSKLAIIGTAGRGSDAAKISRDLYDAMHERVVATAAEWGVVHAISGGAAVADHLAVRGYLDGVFDSLTLYLPAEFKGGRFVPNPRIQFNPGLTLTRYHEAFSRVCDIDSISEIATAIEKGAAVESYPGFQRRNLEVAASCSHMLAFTFGSPNTEVNTPRDNEASGRPEAQDFKSEAPGFSDHSIAGLRDGGTAHTWRSCWKAEIKRHVHLGTMFDRINSASMTSEQSLRIDDAGPAF